MTLHGISLKKHNRSDVHLYEVVQLSPLLRGGGKLSPRKKVRWWWGVGYPRIGVDIGIGNHPEPLQMTSLPPEVWHIVHVDFVGQFPTGEYLLVTIDAYSRYREVDIIHSTSATATINKLDRIFATHGIPKVVRSDNGPPFTSNEIQQFMQEKGIVHQKITLLWPQANSEAKNFMKQLTKAIRSAHTEGQNWKRQLYQFLLNYRATPHCTTGLLLQTADPLVPVVVFLLFVQN